MKPLRICFLIQAMSDGGAQKQCIYLLNELAKRADVELHLIYFFHGVHDPLLNKRNIHIERLPVKSNYDPRNILRLHKLLVRIQPDLLISWLHACDTYSFFLRLSMPTMRWIMTERNSFYPRDMRFWLRRQLGKHADAIISNSPQGDAYWHKAGARGLQFMIPNIVPRSVVTHPQNRCENSVVHIGRLEPQKNVIVVVRAFCVLADRRSDLRFSFIGDGSLRPQLEAIAREAGLSDRIKFLGFQSDVSSYISTAGVVVSMSHHEGLPNVLLEAVAAGTPIAASDIPEHRDLLGPDYAYYVEKRNDVDACAASIERALREQERSYGYAKARLADMTAENIGDLYVNAFRTVAANR